MSLTRTQARLWLVAILLLAGGLRLGLLFLAHDSTSWAEPLWRCATPDSVEYVRLGEQVRAGSFETKFGRGEIFRTPGYPLWVSAFCTGASAEAVANNNANTISQQPFGLKGVGLLLAQIAIDLVTVWLGYLLARRLSLSRRAGLFAALCLATSPLLIASSIRILSDTLFLVLFTAALVLLLRWVLRRRGAMAIDLQCVGLLLAAGAYVRPVGLVFAAGILLGLFAIRRWRGALVLTMVGAVLCGPWVMRNVRQEGYWGFSSAGADSAYFTLCSVLEAGDSGEIVSVVREAKVDQIEHIRREKLMSEGALAQWRWHQAKPVLLDHPAGVAIYYVRGVAGALLPGAGDVLVLSGATTGERGTVDVLQRRGFLAALNHYFGGDARAMIWAAGLMLLWGAMALGCVLAVWRWVRGRAKMPAGGWCLAAIAAMVLLLPNPALPRYRIPAMVILAVLSAAGWARTKKPADES